MSSDNDPIDEIADGLEDMKTSVDELQDDPPGGVSRDTLAKMQKALENASDVADELESQTPESESQKEEESDSDDNTSTD